MRTGFRLRYEGFEKGVVYREGVKARGRRPPWAMAAARKALVPAR